MGSSATKAVILIGLALATATHAADAAAAETTKDPRDFGGTWMRVYEPGDQDNFFMGTDLPYKPETQNIVAERLELFKNGRSVANAHHTCRPTGVLGMTAPKATVLVAQTQQQLAIISQEDREVRHIHLDRSLPAQARATYSGHSVGRWEENTLVIETIGFNDKGQLDEVGTPHSEQLRVTERWTKDADDNGLTVEFTFTDSKAYTRAFTKTRAYRRISDVRILDHDCAENPREDGFENLTFQDDWFKPVCIRHVNNGVAAEKVVCTRPMDKTKP